MADEPTYDPQADLRAKFAERLRTFTHDAEDSSVVAQELLDMIPSHEVPNTHGDTDHPHLHAEIVGILCDLWDGSDGGERGPEGRATKILELFNPPDVQAAKARLAEFIRQYAMQMGNDPEVIYGFHGDLDAKPAMILVSDLKAVIR